MNTTARTNESVVFFINPFGERKLRTTVMMVVLPFLSFFGATVFAEPAVAKVKEVRCLEHLGE